MFERDEVLRDLRRRMNTAGSVAGFVTGGAVALGAALHDSVTSDESGLVLPVAPPLAAVLPRGGLARGSVVSVLGQGATSLLFTLLAGPEAPWSALVGMPGIGLLAAAEFGIDLDRLVVIPEPGPDVLQVLSILVDGVDMIAVDASGQGAGRARPGSGCSPAGFGSTALCCW